MICLLYRFHRRVTSSLSSYFSRNSSSSTSPGKSLWSYYHLCFMHRSSTILCPIACWVGTWKLWLHIVVSCGRHPTTPLLGPGRQISYCYAWVDGISVECITRVMRGWLNNQDRLRQDFQDLGRNATLGEGRLIGSLENPVDDPGCWRGHDILRKASPRLKETDGYFQDPRLTCTATSHYGLWLGWTTRRLWTGGASRCRRTVGMDGHRQGFRGTRWKTMFWSSGLQTPLVRGHTRRRSNLVGNVCKTLQSTQT